MWSGVRRLLWTTGVVVVVFGCLPSVLSELDEDRLQGKTVCTAHFEPLVICPDEAEKDEKEPMGYHIELFKQSASSVKMRNYRFKCLKFGDMLNDLLRQGGENGTYECDMGIGGITITTGRWNSGLHFSFPTYRGSLGVLVKGFVNEGSTWSFLKPLHWTVWVAVLLTSLVIPCIVFVIESLSCHGFIHPRDWSQGITQAIWDSLVTLLNFGNFTVQSQEARLIVVGYGFLVLILINTYVANLAAFLTITNIESSIKSVSDLFGKRIMAGSVYDKRLRELKIAVEKPFDALGKYDAIKEFKKSGSSYDAVIYDEPWITHVAGNDCTLFVLSETVSPFDYGFAFPSDSKDLEEKFSQVLVGLQENGNMTRLLEAYVTIQRRDCPADEEVSDTQAVSFNHMVGLWIILAGCVGVAVLALLLKWWKRCRRARVAEGEPKLSTTRTKTIVETAYHPHALEKRLQKYGHDSIQSQITSSVKSPEELSAALPDNGLMAFQSRVHGQLRDLRKDMELLLEKIEHLSPPDIHVSTD